MFLEQETGSGRHPESSAFSSFVASSKTRINSPPISFRFFSGSVTLLENFQEAL